MEIEAKEASTLLGLILTILGLGKLYGNKAAALRKNTDDIAALKKKQENDIQSLEKAYKTDLATVLRKLVNDDGEPLLMSYNAHDISQAKCQRLMDERYQRMGKRLDNHDDKLDKILEVVSALKERSVNAKTRHND